MNKEPIKLTITAHFDNLEELETIKEAIDQLRGVGTIEEATITVKKDTVIDLTN
jgi:hypothetical protein